MKKQSILQHGLAVLILMAPAFYLSSVWAALPESVPVHFGSDGLPDRYGSKSELWAVVGILGGVGFLTYLLLTNIHHVDPKRAQGQSMESLGKMALATVLLLGLIGLMIVRSAITGEVGGSVLFVVLGLFLTYTGTLMHSVKPNYFFGIRLPWTLENEENWRKTHQLGSKIWVAGGIMISGLSLFLPTRYQVTVLLTLIAIMVLIPGFYSYYLYRKQSNSEG
jgi:uncharacterized membrane protein